MAAYGMTICFKLKHTVPIVTCLKKQLKIYILGSVETVTLVFCHEAPTDDDGKQNENF